MMMLTEPLLASAALVGGLASAALYARQHRWLDALLAAVAGAALAVALADIRLPAGAAAVLEIDTNAGGIGEADRARIPAASGIVLRGDGAREAEWRDLPARPVQWKPAPADLMWLEFPRSISLGRVFTLSVRRAEVKAGWRLQLLAENKQVLADSGAPAAVAQLSVQWLPPVAEAMVLQARLLDADGKVTAQGPVPVQVTDAVPLQIQGRFEAPSFDARALNQLLADGGAVLDWNVALGKGIARSETARAPLVAPNALFVDAAYVEHLTPSARAGLLAQVARGVPLMVLGGNANDAALWQRDFALDLHPQSATTEKEDTRRFGRTLALPPAQLNPAGNAAAPWSVLARDANGLPWLWQRSVGQGRVIWMGVADWHRYAISEPHQLAQWWQSAMDSIALGSERKSGWQLNDPMPVPGLRSEVCAQGVKAGAALRTEGEADMVLQARADKAESVCAAFWPRRPGWVRFAAPAIASAGVEYVYAANDWPSWQRALRRDATAQYAARAVPGADNGIVAAAGPALPVVPFALVFAASLLALWYREQREQKDAAAQD